jgi:hypothetical protein
MRINLSSLERSGCIVDQRKDEETGDKVIDIQPENGFYLELPTLVGDLREAGISEGIAHSMAEDVRILAHAQSMLARIIQTS